MDRWPRKKHEPAEQYYARLKRNQRRRQAEESILAVAVDLKEPIAQGIALSKFWESASGMSMAYEEAEPDDVQGPTCPNCGATSPAQRLSRSVLCGDDYHD